MAVAGRTMRRALLPGWSGAPSLLASGVLGLGTLIVLSELLGLFGLLDGVLLTAGCVIVGAGALRIEPMLMSPDAKASLAGAGPRDAKTRGLVGALGRGCLRARRRRSVGRADPARARPRHLRRRLALVPHAVRGSHRADGVGDRPAVHRPPLPELVLPAELRAAARRRPAAAGRRLPLAAAEPRVARRRAACSVVHRASVRRRGASRRRGGRADVGQPVVLAPARQRQQRRRRDRAPARERGDPRQRALGDRPRPAVRRGPRGGPRARHEADDCPPSRGPDDRRDRDRRIGRSPPRRRGVARRPAGGRRALVPARPDRLGDAVPLRRPRPFIHARGAPGPRAVLDHALPDRHRCLGQVLHPCARGATG